MFSATFPKSIRKLAQDFLRRPIFISMGKVGSVSNSITQKVHYVEEFAKDSYLTDIMEQYLKDEGNDSQNLMLIFVKMRRTAWRLEQKLNASGYLVASIHGDKSQKVRLIIYFFLLPPCYMPCQLIPIFVPLWFQEREEALESFKTGQIPFLIATDVAARGLDIPAVNFVLNYNLPDNIDDYVHRIGRTVRTRRQFFFFVLIEGVKIFLPRPARGVWGPPCHSTATRTPPLPGDYQTCCPRARRMCRTGFSTQQRRDLLPRRTSKAGTA